MKMLQPLSSAPKTQRSRQVRIPVVLRLLLVLAVLALLGALVLLLPGMTTRPLLFEEALFTSVSAVTVTGLSILPISTALTPLGKIVLILLTQIGGIGVMVLTVLIFLLLGRRISLLDRIALRSTLGAIQPGAVLGLAARVVTGVLAIEATGALALFFTWRERLGAPRALGYAIFHAISAFSNAGFDLFAGSPDYPGGMPSDPATLTTLSILILLGGLGVPVLTDLVRVISAPFRRTRPTRLLLHTRLTLSIVFILLLLGGLGIFLAEELEPLPANAPSWPTRLGLAFFQSVVARTAGFTISASFESLSPASQFLTAMLMFIGAAPASMGGGITTGTAIALALSATAYLRGYNDAIVARRSISPETTRRAAVVLVVSLLVITVATWLILISHPTARVVDALFEVISAFATCGLSLSFTPQLNGFGQAVLMLVMLWGRLGPLSVVLALARQPEAPRVRYPEEPILIG